jgi:hypothetical protein
VVDDLELEGKTCPCVEGYRCDPATNRCTSEALDADTGGDADAGFDAGLDAERDANVEDGGVGMMDGGPESGPPDGGVDTAVVDVGPTTIVAPVLIDTYVDGAMSTVSFGASTQVLVDFDPIVYETYILVDVDLAAGTEIVSATLELECFDEGSEVAVQAVTSAWDGSVTWEDRPTKDATVLDSVVPAVGRVTFDITDAYQAWVDGAPNHGVVLTTAEFNGSDYYSTEHTVAAERPRVVVVHR